MLILVLKVPRSVLMELAALPYGETISRPIAFAPQG
jgi:hypothetical protein